MEMTYRQNGDYLIPDIRLSEQEDTPIGKYGQMRKAGYAGDSGDAASAQARKRQHQSDCQTSA